VLVVHPVGGCLLGVPGLKQLFGKKTQLISVRGGINGPIETLNLKLLAHTQINIGVHCYHPSDLVKVNQLKPGSRIGRYAAADSW
jgi:hypothetical protein